MPTLIENEPMNEVLTPAVYDKYAPAVYGRILGIVKQELIADRLLEKVFVNTYRDKKIYPAAVQTELTVLLNEARNKSNKTMKALHIFRECCAGTTVHLTGKE